MLDYDLQNRSLINSMDEAFAILEPLSLRYNDHRKL
jgi:hypothetical protein